MTIWTILLGFASLGFMVFIHELGHFLAARAVGVEVEAFALGWGPTILRRKGKATEYRLAAFPIGGYCKMKGEQDMNDALQNRRDHLEPSPGSFYAAKPWQRIIISLAGPLMNLVFAIAVMSVILYLGYSYQSWGTRVGLLADYPELAQTEAPLDAFSQKLYSDQSPAALAGFKSGDRVLAINGKAVKNFREIQGQIQRNARETLVFTIERDGARRELQLEPALDTESGAGRIGIMYWIDPVVAKARQRGPQPGLEPGDRLLAINGSPVASTSDVERAVLRLVPRLEQATVADPIKPLRAALARFGMPGLLVRVERDSAVRDLEIPVSWRANGYPYLDYELKSETFRTDPLNPLEALGAGAGTSFEMIGQMLKSLKLFLFGLNPLTALSGPGRIVYYTSEVASQGFSVGVAEGLRNLFQFMAFLSLALFFGNLLPIPALDGGQILLFAGEAIRRKPFSPNLVQRYQIVGAALVFGLLILALLGDGQFFFRL